MNTSHAQIRAYAPWRWSRRLFAATLVCATLVAGALSFARPAYAAGITVTTTADEYDTAGTGTGCSLREAIQAANTNAAFGGCAAGSGADTITFDVNGTFQITRSPGQDENSNVNGDFDLTSDITISGNGAANTVIDGGSADRVFDVAPLGGASFTIELSGLTIQNGKAFSSNFNVGGGVFINSNATVTINNSTIANNQSVASSGGAIENRGALTLNTVTLQNNTAFALGGAINNIGALTVSSSTFSGNKAESGGALFINTDAAKSVSISGSSFRSNQTVVTAGGVGDNGGAIAVDTDGTVNIAGSTFTANSAAQNGGAIYFNDSATQAAVGTLTLSYSRIAGNTAAAGSGLFRVSGTATAEKNWWGCNSGPAAGPCDLVAGTVDFTPWIVLSHTANPATIGTVQAATLSADFLKNSDASVNAAGDLGALVGVPVTFGNAVLGTISSAQTSIQTNGAATATYTAGTTAGAGSAAATVDSATVTANLTINRPTTTVVSITRSGTSPTNAASVAWTVTFADAISGLSASNFNLVPSGLVGAGIANVSGSGTGWTVTANSGTGAGTLGLNLANDTGLDKTLSNLAFTGEVYVVDTAPPDTTITAYPLNPSTSAAPTFSFIGSDTGSGVASFQCSLDNAAVVDCASPQSYSNLADGSHTFQVRAVDSVGNVDPTPASYTWVIDSSPPDTTIDSHPANPSNNSSPTFAFSGSDSGSGVAGFRCSLDNAAVAVCTSPQSYSNVADGSHTFQVNAVDGAGNVDPTPASYTWTIDATQPSVAINQAAGQADPATGSPINFTVVFAESVTGFGDGDVTLGGTAGATTAVVSGGPTTYNVAVSGMTTDGTVVASIPAGSATDGASNFNTASTSTDDTVTFIANQAPTAVADSYSTDEDTPLNVAAPGVLANDSDPDTGDTLTAVLVSGPSHAASFALNANGSFSYTPAANYNGPDSFSYMARDSHNAESSPVTVSITVNAVNDPPTVAVAAGGACSSTSVSGTMNLAVGDTDSPVGGVTLTGSSSNTKLVPTGNIVFGGNNASRTVTIKAVPQKNSQTALITITAHDGAGGTFTVQFNVIAGTDKKETINGTSIADMIFGLNGDDTISAGNGNDLVCGGNGSGVINGGAGDDTLDGSNGADTLRGDAGNDILRGGAGNDRLEGGDNDDTLTGNAGADFFSGGPGTDSATDFKPGEGDTQDGTLETISASAASLGDPSADQATDVTSNQDDTQDQTLEPPSPGSVEMTEHIYLPVVAQQP